MFVIWNHLFWRPDTYNNLVSEKHPTEDAVSSRMYDASRICSLQVHLVIFAQSQNRGSAERSVRGLCIGKWALDYGAIMVQVKIGCSSVAGVDGPVKEVDTCRRTLKDPRVLVIPNTLHVVKLQWVVGCHC